MTTNSTHHSIRLGILKMIIGDLENRHKLLEAFEQQVKKEWDQMRRNTTINTLNTIRNETEQHLTNETRKQLISTGIKITLIPTAQTIKEILTDQQISDNQRSIIRTAFNELSTELNTAIIPQTEKPSQYASKRLLEIIRAKTPARPS